MVGYDVTHPGKPSRDEVMNKMSPQKPSVVGVNFYAYSIELLELSRFFDYELSLR